MRVDRSRAAFERVSAQMVPTRLVRDVDQRKDRFAVASKALSRSASDQLARWTDKLSRLDQLRETLGYQATLDRGYAVVWAGDVIVTSTKAAKAAQAPLDIQFRDGKFPVAKGAAKPAKTRKTPPKDGGTQGSLFEE